MEHFRVEPVCAMDEHSGAAHLTVTIGYIFSGVVNRSQIESAVNSLIQKWPILGVRFRRSSSNVLEALIPDARYAVLATTFYTTFKGIHQVESLPVRTSTITTQRVSRNPQLYFEKSQPTLEELVSSQSPAFRLHVSCLADATVFAFTFPHLLMGASGAGSVMRGLISLLEGGELLDELEENPWVDLLNTAPPGDNLSLIRLFMYGPSDLLASAEMQRMDLERDGPISRRTIYFPPAEIARLKDQAMEELKALGLEVPFLSSGDVVVAWLYKHFYGDEQDVAERTNRLIYPLDVQCVPRLLSFEDRAKTWSRKRLSKAFPPAKVYLKNSTILNYTSQYTNCKIRDMTLGELAKIVREVVTEGSKQEIMLDYIRGKHSCVGGFQGLVPPAERVLCGFASNWLAFDLGNLDISKVIKPSTGTGKVLDIYCCVPDVPRCCGCITFRNQDGGISAVFDWGEVNWTSGLIARYAIENTVSDECCIKSTSDGINGV
ncbi:Transferase family [Rhizoctonia solani]|uniref:Transferase family n=1 Tax=Rhizoctonia solani TaxID=456999 RepID=A0A8H7H4R7_9AGAM|nr:Transferase family [Rhizoctonia solani]